MKKILMEMLEATKNEYVKIVREGNGCYHNGRCKDSIHLVGMLVRLVNLVDPPEIVIEAPTIEKLDLRTAGEMYDPRIVPDYVKNLEQFYREHQPESTQG